LLNGRFVAIKVDREERPDVDAVYMASVQAMTGQGGWPLSVFLNADRKPFFGGTYFPPTDRFGRPGFKTVLARLDEMWRTKRKDIDASAEELTAHVAASGDASFRDEVKAVGEATSAPLARAV